MKSFGEVFAETQCKVASPDGNIRIVMTGGFVTDVEMAVGAYSRYDEPELEIQIVGLIKLATVARERARRKSMAEVLGADFRRAGIKIVSQKHQEYAEKLSEIMGEAHSDRVSAYTTPAGFWDVEICSGSLKESSGTVFLDEALGAISGAISDLEQKIIRTNNEVFGHISDLSERRTLSRESLHER